MPTQTARRKLTTQTPAPCLAKFKNHPLDQVCCAYGTGLCTEHTPEKGPGGHGGRGRKLKEQQQQQQQQGGAIPVVNQPQGKLIRDG